MEHKYFIKADELFCNKCKRKVYEDAIDIMCRRRKDDKMFCYECFKALTEKIDNEKLFGKEGLFYGYEVKDEQARLIVHSPDVLEDGNYVIQAFYGSKPIVVAWEEGLKDSIDNKIYYHVEVRDGKALVFFHPEKVVDVQILTGTEKPIYRLNLACFQEWITTKETVFVIKGNEKVLGFCTHDCLTTEEKEAFESLEEDMKLQTKTQLQQGFKNSAFMSEEGKALHCMRPKQMLDYYLERIKGQDTEIRKAVYMLYTYLQEVASGEPFVADNWLLTGGSGSGKTEFYRVTKSFFTEYDIPIPVIQIDLSNITETGYKGKNVDSIARAILETHKKTDGTAICFLDEADKKFTPSYDGKGRDINAQVQGNLLTMLEGCLEKHEIDEEQRSFDSGKTMFVLMGAFQSIRNEKQQELQKGSASIGFAVSKTDIKVSVDKSEDVFYDDLTLQDMIDYGMQEELAGRISQVINFHKLSESDMRELLEYKVEKISDEMGIKIEIAESAMEELLAVSYGPLGARHPMNKIKELVRGTVAQVFFEEGFDRKQEMILITAIDKAEMKRMTGNASQFANITKERASSHAS